MSWSKIERDLAHRVVISWRMARKKGLAWEFLQPVLKGHTFGHLIDVPSEIEGDSSPSSFADRNAKAPALAKRHAFSANGQLNAGEKARKSVDSQNNPGAQFHTDTQLAILLCLQQSEKPLKFSALARRMNRKASSHLRRALYGLIEDGSVIREENLYRSLG